MKLQIVREGEWRVLAVCTERGDCDLLYFRDRDRVVVCSHALVKRGRKVPRGDIDQAQARCNVYRTAREAGTLEVTGA